MSCLPHLRNWVRYSHLLNSINLFLCDSWYTIVLYNKLKPISDVYNALRPSPALIGTSPPTSGWVSSIFIFSIAIISCNIFQSLPWTGQMYCFFYFFEIVQFNWEMQGQNCQNININFCHGLMAPSVLFVFLFYFLGPLYSGSKKISLNLLWPFVIL